jgi:hypothetical protein
MTDSTTRLLTNKKSFEPARAEPVPALHREHREEFERFVVAQADPWHREQLTALYAAWHTYNACYFQGAMTPSYILLAEPLTPQRYGDTARATGFGARLQIRLRPSLARGTHPDMQHGTQDGQGIQRVVQDILLHETIHQYQLEILGTDERSYDGHGPLFRDTANAIGEPLGLPPVRASKVRAAQRTLPSCAQWPHNVRPADYYCGALRQAVPPSVRHPEDVLFDKLVRLTQPVDLTTLERLCE